MPSRDYLMSWGDPDKYSRGMQVVIADRQLRRGLDDGSLDIDDSMGNSHAKVVDKRTGKWTILAGGWGNDSIRTAMLGAACGDVAGSIYEHRNIKHKLPTDHIIGHYCRFTDDTVATCAVARGLMKGLKAVPDEWLGVPEAERIIEEAVCEALVEYCRRYPNAGYGGSFYRWLFSEDHLPYDSWGNGSAMRASFAGWAGRSLAEAERLGEISASVTHSHPLGLKGARVVAGSIFIIRDTMRQRNSPVESDLDVVKEAVREYASRSYDIDFTLDEIRDEYRFHVSCEGSVPQAIVAFLEGNGFSDVLSCAISIGGDSDTIAAIAGSLAEACYCIPQGVRGRVIDRLDDYLLDTISDAVDFLDSRVGMI